MFVTQTLAFGTLLRQLRKRAGMTQRDLAAALGYSDSLISSLETGQRQPDLARVHTHFIPALGLQDEPAMAARFLERAAVARGEQLAAPSPITMPLAPPTPTARSATPHRLPALPIELVGRSEIVHQLSNRLLGHGGRLLTLVGPPGVGKTTLALAVATQVQHHYADGALFVPLATVNDATMMAATLVATIAPSDVSRKAPAVRLVELLSYQRLLLLLDNLEQIDGAASLIATLLAECPGVTILATSRERLHLRAEQRCKVPPLELTAAVALFTQRSQAVDENFALNDENRSTIAAICTRLDCLPLALELCAAQVELFAPAQLLSQLQRRPLDLLTNGAHDLPPQQRTLRHAIERSYALLNEAEQTLFRRLGVFVGGFDLVAVKAIGDWRLATGDLTALVSNLQSPVASLQSLIGKSLVRAETLADGEPRFFLLETIREFALEQLQVHGEAEAARQRHYAFYLQYFRTADEQLRGPETALWFARLQPDHDNLRAAIQWTLDRDRYEDTAWLILATGWYCRRRGHWYEELGWIQATLPHRHIFSLELRLALLITFFSVARAVKGFETVKRYTDELIELAEQCSVNLLRAGAWHFTAVATPDFAQAAAAWEKAMAFARAASESPGLGKEFGVMADYLFIRSAGADNYALRLIDYGKFEQATALIQESLQCSQARGYGSGVAACLGNLGHIALLQGDLLQAHTLFQQAVTSASADFHPAVLARLKPMLALTTLYHDDTIEARRLLLEGLAILTNIRDKLRLSHICIYLAEAALWENKPEEAEQWLVQCLNYQFDPRWIGIAIVNCFFVAARLAVIRQHYQQAVALFSFAEVTRQRVYCTLVEPVRAQVDADLAKARAMLDPVLYAEAFAMGQQLALNDPFTMQLVQALPAFSSLTVAAPTQPFPEAHSTEGIR